MTPVRSHELIKTCRAVDSGGLLYKHQPINQFILFLVTEISNLYYKKSQSEILSFVTTDLCRVLKDCLFINQSSHNVQIHSV